MYRDVDYTLTTGFLFAYFESIELTVDNLNIAEEYLKATMLL